MTLKDTGKLLAILKEFYPRVYGEKTKGELLITTRAWQGYLSDLDPQKTLEVVRNIVLTSKWPPTIAEIREAYAKATTPKLQLDADAEWAKVQGIAARGMYAMKENPQMFDILADETRDICQIITWWNICKSSQPDTQRRFFYELFGRMQDKELVSRITREYDSIIQREYALLEAGGEYD